jgi:photosystem II stability/assembly factor-like uncharacterized protein
MAAMNNIKLIKTDDPIKSRRKFLKIQFAGAILASRKLFIKKDIAKKFLCLHKPLNFFLFVVLFTISISGCKVRIFDLQPIIPTIPSPTVYTTPTIVMRQTNPPEPAITNTPPIHLAPTQILQMTAIDILDLVMINGAEGWGIGKIPQGEGKIVVRTSDGGVNWKNVTPYEAIYANVGKDVEISTYFLDANRAWILFWETNQWTPQTGMDVWMTADGGVTWNSSKLPVTGYTIQYFNNAAIGFIDASIGWIFANLGKNQDREYIGLYTTHDGGESWTLRVSSDSINLPSKGGKNGAVFRNALEGWISGSNTRDEPDTFLWQTTDGGNPWTKVNLPKPEGDNIPTDLFSSGAYTCSLTTPKFVDFQYQYAWTKMTCTGGSLEKALSVIYWTYDAGKSWRTMQLPKADGSLEFYGIYQGWYSQLADPGATSDYEILYTSNGGVDWNVISRTAWKSKLHFITPVIGWGIVEYQGRNAMVKTEDGGFTWSQILPMVNP